MWVLLSSGLRRWVVFTVAVPVAGRLLAGLGRRVEASSGPTKLSRGLLGAGRLVSSRARKDDPRNARGGLLRRRPR
ncbi:hypothetical protein AB1207_23925 [Kineococcus endophyticus]|uniref:Secreted protein n=1 Tax=Kineococcus endophyticus TaxID=1181883 RepID=A0ABV3PDT6_9ACTN